RLSELAAALQDVGDLAHGDGALSHVAKTLVDRKLFLPPDPQRLIELAAALQDVGDLATRNDSIDFVSRCGGEPRGLREQLMRSAQLTAGNKALGLFIDQEACCDRIDSNASPALISQRSHPALKQRVGARPVPTRRAGPRCLAQQPPWHECSLLIEEADGSLSERGRSSSRTLLHCNDGSDRASGDDLAVLGHQTKLCQLQVTDDRSPGFFFRPTPGEEKTARYARAQRRPFAAAQRLHPPRRQGIHGQGGYPRVDHVG